LAGIAPEVSGRDHAPGAVPELVNNLVD